MINNSKSNKLLLRDGTSQQDRFQETLQSDYVRVEGRSLEELIAEAQRLAKELQFFDAHNQPAATWESFLIDDPVVYGQNSLWEKQNQQKRWASQLAAYVENPDRFIDDKTRANLSRPHSVLFLTFLKLLNQVKSQINGLTQKHLDFYFQERLRLTPKGAVPDVVNVLLELVENIDQIEVKKGTVLLAGKDEDGNELHYTIDQDTVISQAKIAQLKNVFVDKQVLTIKTTHLKNSDKKEALTEMMQLALGHPNPSDSLPEFPNGIVDVFELNDEVQKENKAAISYVSEELFLSLENFKLIFEKHQEEKEGKATDWQEVYDFLDVAFKEIFKNKRRQTLKDIRENEGFDPMLKHVYGSPLPGDELPIYRGNRVSFAVIFDDFQNGDTAIQKEASDYINEELKLTKNDFEHIQKTSRNPNAVVADWNKVYKIVELADRQVRKVTLPSPVIEQVSDIYAAADAKTNSFSQYGDEEESVRFKTFGSKPPIANQPIQPADIGFAISSPTLLLNEGKRQITTLIDLGVPTKDEEFLESLFDEDTVSPFQIYLSSKEQWFTPKKISYATGNYLGLESEGTYRVKSFEEQIVTVGEGEDFTISDTDKYLVFANGDINKITSVISSKAVKVSKAGRFDGRFEVTQKFTSDQVYLNSLKVVINLSEEDLPVTPLGVMETPKYISSADPSIAFALNHILNNHNKKGNYQSSYQKLMGLAINKVHLQVQVGSMHTNDIGLKNLTLQNDQNTIDIKKPFEPFGFEPEVGNSFYFTNEEIAQKKLFHLDLDLQWVKQPKDFGAYYKSYWLIDVDPDRSHTIESDDDLKAKVFFHDNNAEIQLSDLKLFGRADKTTIYDLATQMRKTTPGYQYNQDANSIVGAEEVLDWDRYFRLELDPLDFQHSVYNTLFARQALSEDPEIKTLKINPPYQPKLKSFNIGYSAYTDINLGASKTISQDKIYHLHPFGHKELNTAEIPSLLPKYKNEGILYLGISQLKLPQVLSILFQMAEGSADPDAEKPILQWCYLRHNEWISLSTAAILSDTTNGLVNTGIIQIAIPADATTGGTLMPNPLHWLKISATSNISGISDTIDISAQAISATFSSNVVAASHFEKLLAAESITKTLVSSTEIKTIIQPFTSQKGKPAEQDKNLYKRLSERLRHKNRALTMWDYEHMVLNEFPQVYKAKCLPSEDQLGKVNVIVIPDIKGRLPFNPFAPKVAADTLFQIREYLDNYSSAYAQVNVLNPFYLQVLTRCTVQFNPGFDTGFYKEKLIEEIKRFLSPWAYDQERDIRIAGSLHASVLINFIAERPYIDYVANLKLFQSEDGKTFVDVRTINEGKTIIVPTRPDMVLVSAPSHEIDIVDENGYDEDSFEGIDYMKVELDFIIG